jgi:hypothetical protein
MVAAWRYTNITTTVVLIRGIPIMGMRIMGIPIMGMRIMGMLRPAWTPLSRSVRQLTWHS